MNRLLKYAFLTVVFLLLVGCLCSCDYLDDLKEKRIDTISDDRSILEYKGNKYMMLDNQSGHKVNTDDAIGGLVVENDVPLLLMPFFGSFGQYIERKNILVYRDRYYCTLDKHEAYQRIFDEGVTDNYSCVRYFIDYEKMHIDSEVYLFPDELTDVIKDTLKNKVGREISASSYKALDKFNIDSCDSECLIYDARTAIIYVDDNKKTCGLALYGGGDKYIIKEMPEGSYEKYAKLFKQFNYYNVWEEFMAAKHGEIIYEAVDL